MIVMARVFGLMIFILAQAAFAQTPPALSIFWDTNAPAVRVLGLGSEQLSKLRGADAEELQRVLRVSVEPANVVSAIGLPAMLGACAVREDFLEFVPSYPFEPGLSYRATFLSDGQSKPLTSVVRLPKPMWPRSTGVDVIYPTTKVIPQNLLKFYVHFSAPMRGGHIYEHIALSDENGAPVELPFLEIDEELWNPEMTRLTLFLDPGRIKREVKPLEDLGPALVTGRRFTLTIRDSWLDARGVPMKTAMRKTFRVADPDREAPDPKQWRIAAPRSGSTDAVVLTFSDPMDQALALRMIDLADASGALVAGRKHLGRLEGSWHFVPSQPWKPGAYRLRVQNIIEDLAGNNIGKPFEVDLAEGNRPRPPAETITLDFAIH